MYQPLIIAAFVVIVFGIPIFVKSVKEPPKPVNTLTPEHQLKIWTEAHNKLVKRVQRLETELDRMKRQLAGELPSIKGGVSYD